MAKIKKSPVVESQEPVAQEPVEEVKTPEPVVAKPEPVVEAPAEPLNEPVAEVKPAPIAPQAPQAPAAPMAPQAPQAPKAPIAPMAKAIEVKPKASPAAGFEKSLEDIRANGSAMQKMVVNNLSNYVKEMMPGRVMSADNINRQQNILWSTIKIVIESEKDFANSFPLIIEFFRNYRMVGDKKGPFHDDYLYRGTEHTTMSSTESMYFLGMLNLLTAVVESKSKKQATTTVDLNRVLSEQIYSDEGRNRVINFFHM